MNTSSQQRSFTYKSVIGLLVFLSISAIPAGASLVADPSGAGLGMTSAALEQGPFRNYLIPGLFLLLVLGVWSLLIAYGLWRRPAWRWIRPLVAWTHRHWAWGAAVLQGIVLITWIVIQVAIVGLSSFLQPLYLIVGIAIIGLCLLPSVRQQCAES